jgi:DNA-binding IclR family transcriptional regulator
MKKTEQHRSKLAKAGTLARTGARTAATTRETSSRGEISKPGAAGRLSRTSTAGKPDTPSRDNSVSASSDGEHRNIARILAILNVLARASARGQRLTDVAEATGMGKSTTHRILSGMAAGGLVEQDEETGRFFVGLKMLAWANAARERFAFARFAEPAIERLAQQTQDTVYLVARTGDEIVCLDCREGAFPIKVLTLNVGDRRPLGIGAGSLSILAALPDDDIERILAAQSEARSRYSIDDMHLRNMIAGARRDGYAYNNIHVLPGLESAQGMAGIGMPIRRGDGLPVAALHITAVTSRLDPPRRESVVASMRHEALLLETQLKPLLDAVNPSDRARAASTVI